jgi:cytochrome P450 family 103
METTSQRTLPEQSIERPATVTLSIAELDREPHALYRRYRPVTPLLRREDGSYLAIRAADVQRLITDPRTRQLETELIQSRGIHEGALFDFYKHSMLFSNGKDHRRRRAPLSRAFAVRLIDELRPRIRAVAERLIDDCSFSKEMDFLNGYCAQIPARVISDILGIPQSDVPRFTQWVYSIARAIGYSFGPQDVAEIEESARQMAAYVADLLAQRRSSPRDDFLTSYTRAVDEAGDLSPVETLTQVVTIIMGGSDTTRTSMAMMVALLLQDREQWDAVCNDPALIPGAVAEALRYEPPVGSVPRFTVEDIELDGSVVPRQRVLSLSTLSAMRDPELYADPDTFDIRRTDHPAKHLVFGGGVHRCLGESLGRAELEESLRVVCTRLPELRVLGEAPRMSGHSGIRRISGMRVGWR